MSVIQISKIQVRRGRKLSDIGVPQLSSAEFAWAVDTQELFIGNGSLAEGAPFVGNTKILTEHDNLLDLAGSYRFGSTDPSLQGSVSRSLQSKLDEWVSVADFGAVPDGSTDCTAAFHAAFEALYKNPIPTYRKVLFVPNGVYAFFSDLKIPSRAIIRGENPQETILDISNNSIIFTSENGTLPGDFTTGDVPIDISISNLTIDHRSGQTVITGSLRSTFNDVIWRSEYNLGETVFVAENANGVYNIPIVSSGGNITISGSGVSTIITQDFAGTYTATLTTLVGRLNADSTFGNLFVASVFGTSLKITCKTSADLASSITANITVNSLPNNQPGSVTATVTPVLVEYTDGSQNVSASVFWENTLFGVRTSDAKFNRCKFIDTSLAIECQQSQLFDTNIDFDNCEFNTCDTGIYIGGVTSQGNFWNVTDCLFDQIAGSAITATRGHGINISGTKFRNCGNGANLPNVPSSPIVKFGESYNNVIVNCSSDRHQAAAIVSLPTVVSVIEFENASKSSLIDRNYTDIFFDDSPRPLAVFSAFNKSITLDYTLTLGSHTRTGQLVMSVNNNGTNVSVTDNYTYSSGGVTMTEFEFSAEVRDNNSDTINETVLLRYRNPVATGALGSISYSVSYSV